MKSQAQTHELYPKYRTNLCFYGGAVSAITYTVAYDLLNRNTVKKNHLKPTLVTAGVSLATTALVYSLKKQSSINRRQDATAWLAPCVVSITLLRIGIK